MWRGEKEFNAKGESREDARGRMTENEISLVCGNWTPQMGSVNG
jgi:hypothetical protein